MSSSRKVLGGRLDGLLLMLLLMLLGAVLFTFGGDKGELQQLGALPEPESYALAPQLAPRVSDPKADAPLRFVMYNVQNYFVKGERQRSRYVCRAKSVASRNAVAEVLSSARPDVVGLIEIGGKRALADLRQRLATLGLDYPYYRVLDRQGDDRALAILSKYPLLADNSKAQYGIYGQKRRKLLRGILDVTIGLPDGRAYRVVGAHLKSQVSDNKAASDSLRGQEARTFAMYLQRSMREHPMQPLLLFGDWNDSPSAPTLAVLGQGLSKDAAMRRLISMDSRGEEWTHYYRRGHRYLIYDQIYVNKALSARLGSARAVIDVPVSSQASDHRAVYCELL